MLYFKYATIAANPWEILLRSKASQEAVHMVICEKKGEKKSYHRRQGLLERMIFLTF